MTLSIHPRFPYVHSEELSSFQMKGFSSTKPPPHIALMAQTKGLLASIVSR